MTAGESVTWDPPGPGMWSPVLDHFPKPACRLFVELFPAMIVGSTHAAHAYGTPVGGVGTLQVVNGWMYFGRADAGPDDHEAMDAAARETLETSRWREEVRRWHEQERPSVLAANLALQGEDLSALDDEGLADHVRRAVAHYRQSCPLHFAHQGFALAAGTLIGACEEWGIESTELVPLLAGGSPASTAVRDHLATIAAALREAGVARISSVADIDAAGPAAAEALARYLELHGHRLVENRDLVDPALHERSDLIVATINGALARGVAPPAEPDVARVRDRVPADERDRFDTLLADMRASYALGDDDEGICFLWPLGLIRRAVLEAGSRLVACDRLKSATDLLDATTAEIDAVLAGEPEPSADELAQHAAYRRWAATLTPPDGLGSPGPQAASEELPPHVQQLLALRSKRWPGHVPSDDDPLRGVGIGTGVYRGRACFVTDDLEALNRIEPGDVLVATATNPGFNAVFPIVGAVVCAEGGLLCHAAVLSRELGLPAVIGVRGIRQIRDGDVIEVDAAAGLVRILDSESGD